MAKKHLIILTDKENDKLQKIKKDLKFDNVNEVIKSLINEKEKNGNSNTR